MNEDLQSLLSNIDMGTPPHLGVGSLLVAEPFLAEDWFRHAVGIVVDYSMTDGTIGLMLNQLSSVTLDQVLDCEKEFPVYVGGPVANDRLTFLHTLGEIVPKSQEIMPGLWLGGDFDEALRLINDNTLPDGLIRFFIGHSGWSRGQLEQEIDDHVWAVTPSSEDPSQLLTGSGDAYWHRVVRSMGQKYRGWLYHPRDSHSN